MKSAIQTRLFVSLLLIGCMLLVPVSAFAKKGDVHFKKGMQYETSQQWEKAAQEFTLAVAADPANTEYQLHFRRATFNASQAFMQQGRALAEQTDYVGAYNAFRQAYGYDPVNQLAVSEMERMLRLQSAKDGNASAAGPNGAKPADADAQDATTADTHKEQLREVINFTGDLKQFIRKLADDLGLNVVFDRQSFAQPRQIEINLKQVTTAQALDYVFLQEALFFQKLSRRTILVADQTRRAQYQELVLRTFYLSNVKPDDAKTIVTAAIPASVGRPQTIVVSDKETNSLTVRDTAENVSLIGELLKSLDKDRAEVVMDVNIYEVTNDDLMQLGNQLGSGNALTLGGSPGFSLLSSNGVLNNLARGVNLASVVGGIPTSAAAALVFPSTSLTAFQSRNHAKLVASTQVHAFNNEESSARIGQRVPVQTASVYGYGTPTTGTTTGTGAQTGVSNGVFGSNGYPVINYEPTGLTLKFTPLVFPDYDVQVKMSIESKDVTGANSLTPTFTERTITGTARVQNNRTMLLASVSQDIQSNGRAGLPVLGGLPILGRLFTSPTRENRQVDIVIAVTPRVLRAPAVTPRDEEMRPSGTLSNPTKGTIASVLREADREDKQDQIAEARRLQQEDARANTINPAGVANAGKTTSENGAATAASNRPLPSSVAVLQPAAVPAQSQSRVVITDDPPGYMPAPKSLVNSQAAAEVAAINTSAAGNSNAVLTSLAQPINIVVEKPAAARVAQLRLASTEEPFKAGEKRRVALLLNSDTPLGLAVLALRFDPRVVKINGVSASTILSASSSAPAINPSIDSNGTCLIAISSLQGSASTKGTSVLLFIDVEAIGAGSAGLVFDKGRINLMGTDGHDVALDLSSAVKQ